MKKERFQAKERVDEEMLEDFKKVVNKVANDELCHLLQKHKLLKKPLLRKERVTSQQIDSDNYDPNSHTKSKEYFS